MWKSTIYLLIMLVCGTQMAMGHPRQKPDREEWMEQMRQYKRSYFTKELELSRDQQNRFFPLYAEMEEQTQKLGDEARTMERRLSEAKDVTEMEYQNATDAIYDAQVRQAQIEREYLDKFREVLTPKQLFQLKWIERKFAREIIKQHNRIRSRKMASEGEEREK